MPRKPGRLIFANPGPTNIPDSVLAAVARATMDFNDPEFLAVYFPALAGLKRIIGTEGELFFSTASGHGAWEAALQNLLSPGETVLMVESGFFSETWGKLARGLGLEARTVPGEWRRGLDLAHLVAVLRADRDHAIRAVCVVHNETLTGVTLPIPEIRATIDAAGHPALLLVDTISSLASIDYRMDEWGVDVTVGGSQKGLMLPAGFSFTAVSARGMAAHARARNPRFYFDWTAMTERPQRSFIGTIPTGLIHGLAESLRLLKAETMPAVLARHARLAEGVRRAVRVWEANDGPRLFCLDPARRSNTVTTLLMPDGTADAVRKVALDNFNVSLAGGLGALSGKIVRIGHLGDLNEAHVLGVLGAIEMSLARAGVPHGRGGITAAMEWFAQA